MRCLFCSTVLFLGHVAYAEDVDLMSGVVARPGDEQTVPADQFKKASPWKIGMSHFGVNANTWATQMAAEAQAVVKADPRISQFVLLDANLSQAKQISDIEELIAQKVDAIIVTPVSPTSADAGIEKAVAAGIPVIVHTGLTETDKFTVDIQGGGENFGKVSGDFLAKELGGKGNIWVLRGLPTRPEDINRYKGLLEAIKGTISRSSPKTPVFGVTTTATRFVRHSISKIRRLTASGHLEPT
ncbi:ABC-type sugar transport system substrate-binding protein [Rhizobium sp. BK077]|uniref:substrate-binding domain-containing protein n=2 Tax=Rhizobium TaxID=379 RepID=UPI0017CF766D|nr:MULTISPECIES: substrate-binding domain-containing protein [unclassified Rhizobium]MBB3302216.1 ABC-type sugar transport system substrate-binding protein [Rhizobium sp. BK112]MBB3371338.1 ABC-type sugar transport system substrate-binding protein [Rhizobium sp. BK077]MBB4182174.1 ABC-type sugar transport system substrate-binding protein [Rhizobium sp. BK109]